MAYTKIRVFFVITTDQRNVHLGYRLGYGYFLYVLTIQFSSLKDSRKVIQVYTFQNTSILSNYKKYSYCHIFQEADNSNTTSHISRKNLGRSIKNKNQRWRLSVYHLFFHLPYWSASLVQGLHTSQRDQSIMVREDFNWTHKSMSKVHCFMRSNISSLFVEFLSFTVRRLIT